MSIDSRDPFQHRDFSFEALNETTRQALVNTTTEISEDLFKQTIASGVNVTADSNLKEVIGQSTTEFAQTLQDIATRINTFSVNNFTHPEVTIVRPDLPRDTEVFGTAEKVVTAAAATVVCLAIIAIVLRLLGPYFRNKKADKQKDAEDIFKSTSDLLSSKLSLTNVACDSVSQSTGNCSSQGCSQSSGSSPVTDWSELSKGSSETQSSLSGCSEDMFGSHSNKGFKMEELHGKHSTTSLPAYLNDRSPRGSSKGSPSMHRRPTDEQVSVISTQSLEPLRLEQNYRNRWDDQFDPCGSLPRGNLSYHGHPSESRLSIHSMASSNGHPTFPIPSKDFVRQMHMHKDRRYPSNTSGIKKEKHVRMSPPNR